MHTDYCVKVLSALKRGGNCNNMCKICSLYRVTSKGVQLASELFLHANQNTQFHFMFGID